MIATVNVGSANSRAKMGKWVEKWEGERKKRGKTKVVEYREHELLFLGGVRAYKAWHKLKETLLDPPNDLCLRSTPSPHDISLLCDRELGALALGQ